MPKQLLATRQVMITFLALLFIGLSTHLVSAQGLDVRAPKAVEVGEQFTVQYSLNNLAPSGQPNDPSFTGLELLFGPALSRSSQTFNNNGHITASSSYTYTYTFIADKAGSYQIKGFSISTSKGELKGRNVVIKVLAGSNRSESILSSKPFISSQTSKKTVYQNEALIIEQKLYVENFRLRYDPLEPIQYKDLVVQDIELNRDEVLDKEQVHGKVYNSLTLAKQIIIPQTAGSIQLPVVETSIYVPIPSQDVFFSSEERRIKLKSKPKTLNVLPLPDEGRPMDFSGAVGKFTVKARFENNEDLETNKAYNVKLHIEGQGNLKSARLPKINFPHSFEVYPATSKQEIGYDKASGSIRSVADVEYSFIPRSKGNFTIPPLTFSFFDPQTKQYKTLKTEAIELSIKKGKESDVEGIIQEANYSDDLLSKYHTEKGANRFEGLTLLSIWYFLSYLLIILITVFIILYLLRYRALRQDVIGFKAKQANSIAVKRLKQAKVFADNKQSDKFYEELLRALWGYVGDKFRMPASMLSRENIQGLFDEKGFDEDIAKSYCGLLDELEFARYAPQQGEGQLHDIYEKAIKLISRIENNK